MSTSSRFCRHESDRPGGDASTSTSCRADTALRRGGTTLQKGISSTSTSCRTDTALRRGGTTLQKGISSTSTLCRADTALRRGGAAGIGVPWKCPDQHQTSRRPPTHPATSTPGHQHTRPPTVATFPHRVSRQILPLPGVRQHCLLETISDDPPMPKGRHGRACP